MSDEANIDDDRLAYPTGLVEKFARAMWERRTGGNWEARMSWKNATPEQRAAKIAAGAHPDNFDWNKDLDDAFADTIAGLRSIQNDWLWANVIEHAIREAEQK